MFVKICGLTNADDALAAIEGGARAVGFNFFSRSPRFVSPDAVARWAKTLPAHVWKVGVFVNEAPARISAIARQVGLDVAQLHGDEAASDFPEGLRVWKTARVDAAFDMETLDGYPAEAVLLDGPADELYGGSGRIFDWSLAAVATRKVIIAGGLDATNVRLAIDTAHPWGVDACSRIETAPGKKDHRRMAEFLKAALA